MPLFGLFGQSNAHFMRLSSTFQADPSRYSFVIDGGTALGSDPTKNDWNPASTGELQDSMLATLANDPPTIGSIWVQGETDTNWTGWTEDYEANFRQFILDYNATTNNAPLVVVMLTGLSPNAITYASDWLAIRSAQAKVAAEFNNVTTLDPDLFAPSFRDNVHYSTTSAAALLGQAEIAVTNLSNEGVANPVADTATTTESAPITINLFANDSGYSGTREIVALNGTSLVAGETVSLQSGALVRLNANGTVTYDANGGYEYLAVGFTAQDNFSYTVADNRSSTTTGAVTVDISGEEDATILRSGTTLTVHDADFITINALELYDPDGPARLNGDSEQIGIYGTFTTSQWGDWAYQQNNRDLILLEAGESVSESFSVTTFDGTTLALTLTIEGDGSNTVRTEADGDIFTTSYNDAGQRVAHRIDDISNSRPWDARIQLYDIEIGELTSRIYEFSNGSTQTAAFEAGVQVSLTETAPDGDYMTSLFDLGILTTQTMFDATEARPWTTITEDFSASGAAIQKTIIFDSGIEKVFSYDESGTLLTQQVSDLSEDVRVLSYDSSGALTEVRLEDGSYTRDWDARIRSFDSAGEITGTVFAANAEAGDAAVAFDIYSDGTSGLTGALSATLVGGGALPDGVSFSNGVVTLDLLDPAFAGLSEAETQQISVTYEVSDTSGASILQTVDVTVEGEDPGPENIIYIMLDDADYLDFGYVSATLSNGDALTPNIDALRAGGMEFSQFYSASAICSPTRASVLTGNSPIQFGAIDAWIQLGSDNVQQFGLNSLPSSVPQLGSLMQESGRMTGHFGKWHVGTAREEGRHAELGFDDYAYHFGGYRTTDDWSGEFTIVTEDSYAIEDVDYLDERFADEVIEFIDENAGSNDGFYANFWPLSPHAPWTPPRDFDNSITGFDLDTPRGNALAMLYTIDQEIGRIVDALQANGELDDTLIIVTSDNGGKSQVQHSTYHRGSKNTLFEGGIHVPMVAYWEDGIAPGTTNDTVMTTADLLPTFVDLTGGDPTALYADISGRSMADAFTTGATLDHAPIVWQMSGAIAASADPRAELNYAYREGEHKIIKLSGRNDLTDTRAYLLYDVEADPGETQNLRLLEPELFTHMKREMLQARLIESRLDILPDATNTTVALPVDPRLDVSDKSMTLAFALNIPTNITSDIVLYEKTGSMVLTLQTDGRLRWDITGTEGLPEDLSTLTLSTPITSTLYSDPLATGAHSVVLSVLGYKRDFATLELHVDGVLVDELNGSVGTDPLWVIWSEISGGTIGGEGAEMSDINYFNLKFFDDEWGGSINGISDAIGNPFIHIGTSGNDEIIGGVFSETISGGNGADILYGGLGTDRIIGGNGSDILSAGAAQSDVQGAAAAQRLRGQEGNDTYLYDRRDGFVFIDQGAESATSGVADRIIFNDLERTDLTVDAVFYANQNQTVIRMQWDDGIESGELRIAENGDYIEFVEFADGQVFTVPDLL